MNRCRKCGAEHMRKLPVDWEKGQHYVFGFDCSCGHSIILEGAKDTKPQKIRDKR